MEKNRSGFLFAVGSVSIGSKTSSARDYDCYLLTIG